MSKVALSSVLALLWVLVAGVPMDSRAEIYKWVDADGRIQFSDQPPPQRDSEEIRLPQLNTYQGVSVEPQGETTGNAPARGTKTKKVVMYSASWCGVCTRARTFFKAEGIPFQEFSII